MHQDSLTDIKSSVSCILDIGEVANFSLSVIPFLYLKLDEIIMDEEINTSELGTQEYWDNIYSTEIGNFKDHGDVGEVWFGEGTSKRIVKWLKNSPLVTKESKIIDIGCGNGMLLIDLCKENFNSLFGIDYSENAINLARSVNESEGCTVNFSVQSILDGTDTPSEYDVALDKGTFDAISLDPDDSNRKRLLYIENLRNLLKLDGLLLITSCNWTEQEIIQQFSNAFTHLETLPSPAFSFGGKTGRTITSVILKKK